MKKNRARTKSWLCFQPNFDEPTIDSDLTKPHHQSIDPVFISLKKQQPEIMPLPILPKISIDKLPCKLKLPSDSRKKSSRRSLSKILKAVFFQSSLRKSKKVQQDPSHTLKNHPHDFKSNYKKSTSKEPKENTTTTTTTSISSSPSSFSSSFSSLSTQKKQLRTKSLERRMVENDSKTKRDCSGVSSINGLYLLLITLLVLVFWGRICAIICTSTWIYFGPFLRKSDEQQVIKVIKEEEEQPKMVSRESKKRVIMEGLLERNHGRF